MAAHLTLELPGGLDALSRLVARLHAVRSPVAELHVNGSRACLHLADSRSARRTRTVVDRLVDVRVVEAPCVRVPAPRLPTTYVVWSEPVEGADTRLQREQKVAASA